MTEWIGMALDGVLILVVAIGIVQAMRLIAQLRDLQAGRREMEKFVREFNAAVMRADAGIKALRLAARESGDDLEKLVEKAGMVRDELAFIVESADGVAERLSTTATKVLHTDPASAPATAAPKNKSATSPAASPGTSSAAPSAVDAAAAFFSAPQQEPPPSSRAEKDLIQALQKLK